MIKINYELMTFEEITTTISHLRVELYKRGTVTRFDEIDKKTKAVIKEY